VSRTRTRSSLSRDLDAWAKDFPAIPASQNCSKNPTTRADPLFEKRTDPNPTVSRAAHPSIIHGTEAPLCSGSQSHGRGGATRRGRWMGTGPGSRHAKNLMRGTKQRKGECRTQGRQTRIQKCTSSFSRHNLPFPIPGSKLAAQCSPFRRAMIGKRIGLRRKSKSRDFTSPE
jgi:hypothetical protein